MNYTQQFSTHVNQEVIFKAISKQLNDWWGKTDLPVSKIGDEFTTSFDNAFWKFRVIDFKNNEKLTWLCIDGKPEFNAEWIGTKVDWNIFLSNGLTKLNVVHEGLTPDFECYNICAPTWDIFITSSLKTFVETGIGSPHQT